MSDILFEFQSVPAFKMNGFSSGSAFIVYNNCNVASRHFVVGQEASGSEAVVATNPDIATYIWDIINSHWEELVAMPDYLDTGILDGDMELFKFGEKEISTISLREIDVQSVYRANPEYFQTHRDKILQINRLVSIYREILSVFDRFDLGFYLERK